eukprot:jgi/Mesen1/3886/ME000208S02900
MTDKLAPTTRHKFVSNGQEIYEWDQTIEEVNIYINMPKGVPARSMQCTIKPRHVTIGIKGNPPYMDHDLGGFVKLDASFWTIAMACELSSQCRAAAGAGGAQAEDGQLHVTLQKAEKGQPWSGAIAGHGELDPYTADQESRRLMLERFQAEHAGFDFSGAEFSGSCPNPATFMGGMPSD